VRSGSDIGYLIYVEGDTIPLENNMTVGNHLDNDIVIAGEDVSDFHLRVELADRGPVLIPLGESTINVNGQEQASPVQVIIGDVIGVGQTTLQVSVEHEQPPEADHWSLHADDGSITAEVAGDLSIGRAEDVDLVLRNEHISRHHARLVEKNNVVWIQDLKSANGTRVNGTPIVGGVRLFHGDTIAFDTLEFQLIGEGQNLTPVNTRVEPLRGVNISPPTDTPADTTEFVAVDESDLRLKPVQLPPTGETGAFLLGISEPVENDTFRLVVGRNLIGRGEECYLKINDNTVSAEHAEIVIRPEGVTITNLMSTNGTRVNSEEIASTELEDGDVIRLGRVSLMYKNVPPSLEDHPLLGKLQVGVIVGALVAAVLLVIVLLT
jgi:pSer/pThr/pTyr-binding forkhead associated (FHA) protein